jgi:UDPglucose 6-dehydrogenase
VGPRAYLEPGDAFAGGTLARDIGFLCELAERHELPAHVFAGVAAGNAAHKHWTRRKLLELLGGELAGRTVAIWGLTYKPGTDTLRRSSAVELCHWLAGMGATVRVHDPVVTELPEPLATEVELCSSPLEAVDEAEALVVCTAWPEYRDVPAGDVLSALAQPLIIDPAGWLALTLGTQAGARYLRVGTPPLLEAVELSSASNPRPPP